ncbi:hypothetical protein CMI37_38020 [Candidatus Pacearchaeota archaeon]|nr:hypothetical protein [Candidatus Pacearchaeota archaeon]|tara:strand:- start:629 stop:1408 length:780 start_codon:yes stop_codon:yes gene_type:complete
MKTPLKDPYDFKCTKIVKELIPRGSVVDSFLLYSGKIEFSLAESGRKVKAHTNKITIYDFWDCALKNPDVIAENAEYFSSMLAPHPIFSNEKMFYTLQEKWDSYDDPYLRSGLFFLLNRSSETGLISSGKFNMEDFNSISLMNMQRFKIKNFNITHDNKEKFLDSLDNVRKTDYLLFPVGRFELNLFEEGKSKGNEDTYINHRELRETLANDKRKWILAYKYNQQLLDAYKNFNFILIDKYGRRTYNKNHCEDALVFNF